MTPSSDEKVKDRLSRIRHGLMYYVSPLGRVSRKHLTDMKNSRCKERCFIIGNGPSLQRTDLSKLRDEYTFGLNRIYLLFPQLDFSTTYLVTVNNLVLEQCAEEILSTPSMKFIPWTFRKHLNPDHLGNTVFIQCDGQEHAFTPDVHRPLWTGTTVTYVAMQLAFHIGFRKVILVGIDHSFTTQGKPHAEIVSQGDDPNHFSPAYFGKGFKWHLPDLETSEIAYGLARQYFQEDGREIVDATIGGKLTIFPKADYSSLF